MNYRMSKQEYDRTRLIPDRIKASDAGKEYVKNFIKTVRDRMVVEQPEHISMFDNDARFASGMIAFYFFKYMAAHYKEGGFISMLFEVNDDVLYMDNLISSKADYVREYIQTIMADAYARRKQ